MKLTQKLLTLLLSMSLYSVVYSQSTETLVYIKEDLLTQRKELLTRIELIDIKLKDIEKKIQQSTGNYQQVQYLEKNTANTAKVYQSSFRSTETPTKTTTRQHTSRSRASRTYHRGSRGGCYYINSNGNKSYVARSMCN